MARKGAAKRKRERLGLPKVKPGVEGWVHGTKLPFFQAHREAFIAAAENKTTGTLYHSLTHMYLGVYGYNTPFTGDLAEGQTVADDVDPDEDLDELPEEEGIRRAAYFKKVRGKIGVWYNAQYGGAVERKKEKVTFRTVFDKPELDPPAPVKPRVIDYYSRKFYEERVKPRVTARWAAVSRLDSHPQIVTVRGKVTKECWALETPAFKAEVIEAMEKEHDVAKEAYSIAMASEVPKTAAEFDTALNNSAYYLQPFADAIRNQYGMNVSILLCGPVADRGGRIEVRSVHSGMSTGLVPRVWSDFDRAGFDAAQRSMVEFSHHCFSDADCHERSLNGMGMPQEETGSGHVFASGAGSDPQVVSSEREQGVSFTHPPRNDLPLTPPVPGAAAGVGLGVDFVDLNLELDLDGMTEINNAIFNWEQEVTPLMGADESAIGHALKAEIVRMSPEDRELWKIKLQAMSGDCLEEENESARNRLVWRRMENGMEMNRAFDLASDDEEGLEENAAAPELPMPSVTRPKPRAAFRGAAAPGGIVTGDAPLLDAPLFLPPIRTPTPPPTTPPPSRPPTTPPPTTTPPPSRPPTTRPPSRPPTPPPRPQTPITAGAEEEGNTFWTTQKQTGWSAELKSAFAAFARASVFGGQKWEECVKALIALETAQGFQTKGMLTASTCDERPGEVPLWMQRGRKWESRVKLSSEIGPVGVKDSFSAKWWSWWGDGQPAKRMEKGTKKGTKMVAPSKLPVGDWLDMCKTVGRNGISLYVGGLLWWGEAAANGEGESTMLLEDWMLAVDDVACVLKKTLGCVPSAKKGAAAKGKAVPERKGETTTSKKRKAPPFTADKAVSGMDKEYPLR